MSELQQDEKPIAYVANPAGFSEMTKLWYYQELLPVLRKYVTVIDPWKADETFVIDESLSDEDQKLAIGDRCLDKVDSANMVIAILDGEPPDNGTIIEATWAAKDTKPVIGYRNDFRTCGEEGLPYNLMVGAMIRRSGGVAVSSLVELEEELQRRTSFQNEAGVEVVAAHDSTGQASEIEQPMRQLGELVDTAEFDDESEVDEDLEASEANDFEPFVGEDEELLALSDDSDSDPIGLEPNDQ